MPESQHAEFVDVERPISISQLLRILRAYSPVIILSTAGVALVYAAVALALYVSSPAQSVVSQHFRLEFDQRTQARYPNGVKFSSSDITAAPVLLEVFRQNHLDRFTTFASFSNAVVVLGANPEYESLADEYQTRLANPRLSAVDRERVMNEWQTKAASIAKTDYSLNWLSTRDTAAVPQTLVKKALLDILSGWARHAENERHVLDHRFPVLSPQVIAPADIDGEPVVAIQLLRSEIDNVLQNIDALRDIPGLELIRTADGMSLQEIRLRLEEINRFRLESLMGHVSGTGLITDRPAALRFVESQLAYDQRHLKALQDYADSIRDSFAIYLADQRRYPQENAAGAAGNAAPYRDQSRPKPQGSTPVVAQISETFLDRLITLASQAGGIPYREKLADEYRTALQAVIPAQQAVAYDQDVLLLVKSAASAPATGHVAETPNQIVATRNEVKELISRIGRIADALSLNLSPSAQLYSLTAPVIVRTERSRSARQLALYGILVIALTLVISTVLCLLHARLREEKANEPYAASREATAV
jgi:hypothetical protein